MVVSKLQWLFCVQAILTLRILPSAHTVHKRVLYISQKKNTNVAPHTVTSLGFGDGRRDSAAAGSKQENQWQN